MINDLFRNILRFILLVLIQVLVIKNIELGKYINPFIYVLFILSISVATSGWMLLLASFVLGVCVDFFYDTGGIHAAACVFMAFCRPYILKYSAPRDGYDFGVEPTIQHFGFSWYIPYAFTLIFLHHSVLFYTEIFRFSSFFMTLFKVILSSLFTLLLIIISQMLIYRRKEEL